MQISPRATVVLDSVCAAVAAADSPDGRTEVPGGSLDHQFNGNE